MNHHFLSPQDNAYLSLSIQTAWFRIILSQFFHSFFSVRLTIILILFLSALPPNKIQTGRFSEKNVSWNRTHDLFYQSHPSSPPGHLHGPLNHHRYLQLEMQVLTTFSKLFEMFPFFSLHNQSYRVQDHKLHDLKYREVVNVFNHFVGSTLKKIYY